MIFIGACLIPIGALLAYLCRKDLVLQWGCGRWPHAAGFIAGSVLKKGTSQGLETDGTFAPVDRSWREIHWTYKYTVEGRTYESSRFNFTVEGWQLNTHHFEDGEPVTVYYCPTDPAIAVLEARFNPGLLVGPVLVALGLGFLVYGLCRL